MIELVTDGSHRADANLGGWAFVRSDGKSRSGAVRNLSSTGLELWAVLEGLASLSRPSDVTVYTDSRYVIDGVARCRHASDPLLHELSLWLGVHRVRLTKVKSERPYTAAHHLAREAAARVMAPSAAHGMEFNGVFSLSRPVAPGPTAG